MKNDGRLSPSRISSGVLYGALILHPLVWNRYLPGWEIRASYLFLAIWFGIPVLVIWAAASYGMFILYFAAGHAGDIDAREIAILTGVLWGAIAVYTALGWGMHYAIRR